ncbi:MAG: transporter ATP-binding protein [Ilumatobacteraceae bacterium]|nr:transporter ATP-binding protein [Ilumatobacteraceae bacterium]MCU1388733.1 transporter ATP-binding protein [Ilumatobacteraceae bacterium]
MIELRGLTKRYGDTLAVDDLSFDITPGCVTGFLGPNGAGKTTTMRMILGLDAPTKGTALVNGKPYAEHQFPLHEVGALLDAKALHGGRRAFDHLLCLAQSNGIGRKRVTTVLEQVGLADVAKKRAGTFSLGMGQRLGIAGALLGDPGVLMFDEPVNGLDPEGIVWIRTLLRWLASEGRTVFVSSHLMTEMAMTADRLIVVGRGKLIADATVEEFTSQGEQWVQVRSAKPDALATVLTAAGGTIKTADGDQQVHGLTSTQIGDLALGAGIAIYGLTEQRATLEEVFFGMTGDSVEYHGLLGTENASAA